MKRSAAALGIFDGIHDGHRIILKRALSYEAYKPAVFTFVTESIKTKRSKPFEYIYTNRQKTELLRDMGFKQIEAYPFEDIKNLSGEEFVRKILVEKMNVGAVICGRNFRFGKNAACCADELADFGREYGFEVEITELEQRHKEIISSELIRGYLREGRVSELDRRLKFRYELCQTVETGNRLGRTIDFPTVNQRFETGQLVPRRGVYESRTYVSGNVYPSVTNIGVKPTVSDDGIPVMETHILGFSGDLYGKRIKVALVDFIREEKKFGSICELKAQIKKDIEKVR